MVSHADELDEFEDDEGVLNGLVRSSSSSIAMTDANVSLSSNCLLVELSYLDILFASFLMTLFGVS